MNKKSKSNKILNFNPLPMIDDDDSPQISTVDIVNTNDEQPKKKRAGNAKTAASRARNTVKKETERKDNKDITVFENGNNNEKILEMSRAGKSNMEIAKTLGIGTGEVKLVVDLFKGGR